MRLAKTTLLLVVFVSLSTPLQAVGTVLPPDSTIASPPAESQSADPGNAGCTEVQDPWCAYYGLGGSGCYALALAMGRDPENSVSESRATALLGEGEQSMENRTAGADLEAVSTKTAQSSCSATEQDTHFTPEGCGTAVVQDFILDLPNIHVEVANLQANACASAQGIQTTAEFTRVLVWHDGQYVTVPPSPGPNTVVDLGTAGFIIINEQESSVHGCGFSSLNAMRVVLENINLELVAGRVSVAGCKMVPEVQVEAIANAAVLPVEYPFAAFASVTGPGPDPTGNVNFFLCGPESVQPPLGCTGGHHSSSDHLENGTAFSSSEVGDELGDWCWRAGYTGDQYYFPAGGRNMGAACVAVDEPRLLELAPSYSEIPEGTTGTTSPDPLTIELETAWLEEVVVSMESSDPTGLGVTDILIPAGNAEAIVIVDAIMASDVPYVVTASLSGTDLSAEVRVLTSEQPGLSLVAAHKRVLPGESMTFTVTLPDPAPPEGETVVITATEGNAPDTLHFPGGSISQEFLFVAPEIDTSSSVTASLDEEMAEKTIDVQSFPFPYWCQTVFPTALATSAHTDSDPIYGQFYVEGFTEEDGDLLDHGFEVDLGFGPDGSHPTSSQWIWSPALKNGWVTHNQEFMGILPGSSAGRYDYAFRFHQPEDTPVVHCDLDGSDNGYHEDDAGDWTVKP